MVSRLFHWFDRNILELGRELRLSYLPPLMVYLAYGISGLTSIVGTYFVKDYLNLSAAFMAALGFWMNMPWLMKMLIGHIVDLIWRYKAIIVFLGAGLISSSLLIMLGLLSHAEAMRAIMPFSVWYILSALLAPVGYVLQDVVADAMTVEAVPRVDKYGQPFDENRLKLMHTTMQTLGRVAIVGGGVFVYLLNIFMFNGVDSLSQAGKVQIYIHIFEVALVIPIVSVFGVILAGALKIRDRRRLQLQGYDMPAVRRMLEGEPQKTKANWWILIGSLVFIAFTVTIGLSGIPYNEEIVFTGSMAIVLFMMYRLVQVLKPAARNVLVGTAVIIFVFRAMPTAGAGQQWWMIDVLHFNQQFFAVLSLIGSGLALFGMFLFRRFMAERSVAYIMAFLTIVGTVLYLPYVGMFYGLHHWTAAHTHGVIGAHFIAIVDTTLESPLGQVAMIPMLAWIANSAPANLKATFFAVMASFTNLALSAGQLGTKYANEIFVVTREVKNHATGAIVTPANYSQLGKLLISVTSIGLVLPLLAILLVKLTRLRSA
ncbi:MAG: hypothetical protein P8Z75_06965 [Gammaproteobacteria bacterium]|jgi:MFS family permease